MTTVNNSSKRGPLFLKELSSALYDFFLSVNEECLFYLKTSMPVISNRIELNIDEQPCKTKSEANSSNGPYYFKKHWDYYIPNCDSKGVYLFFDSSDKALYVGMSLDSIGKRVACHIGKRVDDSFPDLEFKKAEYVITIPFKRSACLAPALEYFLISEYDLPYNFQHS